MCGAWSYDNFEGVCYLHTVESCCGQFGKRETIPGKTFKNDLKGKDNFKSPFLLSCQFLKNIPDLNVD